MSEKSQIVLHGKGYKHYVSFTQIKSIFKKNNVLPLRSKMMEIDTASFLQFQDSQNHLQCLLILVKDLKIPFSIFAVYFGKILGVLHFFFKRKCAK